MLAFVESGYDMVLIIWGILFIGGAGAFIVAMNRVFQAEERRQAAVLHSLDDRRPSEDHPLRPAA